MPMLMVPIAMPSTVPACVYSTSVMNTHSPAMVAMEHGCAILLAAAFGAWSEAFRAER